MRWIGDIRTYIKHVMEFNLDIRNFYFIYAFYLFMCVCAV